MPCKCRHGGEPPQHAKLQTRIDDAAQPRTFPVVGVLFVKTVLRRRQGSEVCAASRSVCLFPACIFHRGVRQVLDKGRIALETGAA